MFRNRFHNVDYEPNQSVCREERVYEQLKPVDKQEPEELQEEFDDESSSATNQ